MSKVRYHCCACQWTGQRAAGSVKPCPACKARVETGFAYDCARCNPARALRSSVAVRSEKLPSAWPGGRIPHVMRILTLDTGRIENVAIPRHAFADRRAA